MSTNKERKYIAYFIAHFLLLLVDIAYFIAHFLLLLVDIAYFIAHFLLLLVEGEEVGYKVCYVD
jgi:hypothetical protein